MYRVLYVDDEPDLLELGMIFLERDGDIAVDTTTSGTAALSLLPAAEYDAIVSDFQMPGMDGIALLKAVRATTATIPFILFTGRGREEVVVDALNNGADFYLQKGGDPIAQFTELAHKIRLAVSRRRAEQALAASESRFRELTDLLPQVVYETDAKGTLTYANRIAFELFGYTPAEFEEGLNVTRMIAPPDRARATETFFKILEGREPASRGTVYQALRKDGSTFPISSFSSPILLNNRVVGLRGIIVDMTESRRAEEGLRASEARFRDLTENSLDTIMLFDRDLRHLYVNPNVEAQTGIPPEKFIGRTHKELGFPKDLCDLWDRALNTTFETGKTNRIEFQIPSGLWIDWLLVPIHATDGSVNQVITSARDITGRKNAEDEIRAANEQIMASEEELRSSYDELANNEQRIRESERALSTLMGNLPGIAYRCRNDEQWTMEFISDGCLELTGYPSSELVRNATLSYADCIHPEDRQYVWNSVQLAVEKQEKFQILYRIFTKDGTEKWVWEKGTGVFSAEGQLLSLEGFITDINDRKRAETALRVSERRLADIIDFTPDATFAIDTGGRVIAWNRAIEEMTDIPAAEIIGKGDFEYAIPLYGIRRPILIDLLDSSDEDLKQYYTDIRREGPALSAETSRIVLKGERRIVAVKATHFFNERGEVTGAIESMRDITEERKAVDALHLAEFSIEHSGIATYWFDRNSRIVRVNESSCTCLGYAREELVGMQVHNIDPNFPGMDQWEKSWAEAKELGEYKIMESVHRRKDGTTFPVEIVTSYFSLGNQEYLLSFVRDISDRKLADALIREREERYRSLIETTGTGYVILDSTGRVITANSEYCRLTGRPSLLEIEGRQVTEWTAPYDLERNAREVDACIRTGRVRNLEIDYQKPDGTIQPVEINATVITSDTGQVIMTICRDISARRAVEAALKNEQQYTRMLLDASPAFFVAIGADGKTLEMNRALIEALEYSQEEVRGADYLTMFVPEEDRPGLADVFRQLVFDGKETLNQNRIISRSGKTYLVEWRGRPVKHEEGRIDFFVGVGLDITGRAAAEENLKESERRFALFMEHLPAAAFIKDADGTLVFSNRYLNDLFGWQDPAGKSTFDLLPKEVAAQMAEDDRAALAQGGISKLENVTDPTGAERVFSTTKFSVPDSAGRLLLGGISLDITMIHRAEEAIRESEARLQSILLGTPSLQFVIDRDHRVIFWNRAIEAYSGITAADIIGTNGQWRAFYPEKRPVLADILVDGDPGAVERWYTGKYRKSRYVEDAYEAVDFFPAMGTSGVWLAFTAAPIRDRAGTIIGAVETLEDVTERIDAKNALQKSEQKYREIFNTVNDTIWIHDIGTFAFVFVNETIEETFGYTPEEALGLRVADISSNVPPFTEETAIEHLKRAAAGEPQVFEWHCRHKDGHLFWSEVSLRRRTIAGRDYILAIERDITDRKHAEEARRESEERYRLLVENIPFGITLMDADHRIIMSNAAQGRMFRTDPGVWPGRYCYREFEKRDSVCPHCPGTRAMATGASFDVETEGVRDDGTRFNARIHAIPMPDPEGRINGFMEMVEDITDRKRAEDALRESEEKYRAIVENMEDMFYRTDPEGRIVMVSPSAAIFAGFQAPPEMIGVNIWQFYPDPADRDLFLAELEKTGSVRGYPLQFRREDGTHRAVTASSHFYYDSAGERAGVEGVLHDVTELQEAGRALQEANRKLALLTSITRHDINNQLFTLGGFLDLLQSKVSDPDLDPYFFRITTATGRIAAMIRFTREYDALGVKAPAWQEAWLLVNEAADEAAVPNVRIINEIPRGAEIYADPLIGKVFFNLVDNAVRHAGKITMIRFRVQESDDGATIFCEDDGNGIAAEEKQKIFDRGFGKNTGLGLFLSREILAITGITITETGEPGKGARFEIAVPGGAWRFVQQER